MCDLYQPDIEFLVEEENQNGAYIIVENDQHYFQTNEFKQATSLMSHVITLDNVKTTAENTMFESGENFQTITRVPSENDSVLSYKLENDANIYNFENKDLDDSHHTIKSIVEEDRGKASSTKNPFAIRKSHTCSYCTYTTSKKFLLTRHLVSHSEERPHKCSMCARGFKTSASLKNHENVHTGTKPYECKFCNMAFTTSGELVRHVRYKHTREKPHKCNQCEYACVELSKLKRHIVRCHNEDGPYQCLHSKFAFQNLFKLKKHLYTHREKKVECEHCHRCFKHSSSLKVHKLTHGIGVKPRFQCDICLVTCGRKNDLRIHTQNMHTFKKQLKCIRCGKNFPDRYTFRLHSKTHEGEKCFKCAICPFASSNLRSFSGHMLVHTNEKPFSCDSCDQTFRQKQLLKRHQNLNHNPEYIPPSPKEKTNKCHDCGELYRFKGNLIRHMAIHNSDSQPKKRLAFEIGHQSKLENLQKTEYDGEMVGDTGEGMSLKNMSDYIIIEEANVSEENSREPILLSLKPYVASGDDSDRSYSE